MSQIEINNVKPFDAHSFVLCCDSGGVLRCRVAAEMLNNAGISAVPVALGDIRKQKLQGEVPPHIVAFFQMLGFDVYRQEIQAITDELIGKATHFLVLCGLEMLAAHMNIDDPRIYHDEVQDVARIGDIDDYYRAAWDVMDRTLKFMGRPKQSHFSLLTGVSRITTFTSSFGVSNTSFDWRL